MDYSRENVVQVIPTNGPENWNPNSTDSSLWATEEDYRFWNNPETFADAPSKSNHQTRPTGDQPPNKKSRNSQEANSQSKAIGKMFFKTKLCCKFRQGTCPYITNCNFAHSVEELRRPPRNWQDIVAVHEEEKSGIPEPREEFQIPSFGCSGFGPETRSSKGRHCKKFYTDEGCPYGDSCTFLHDESSRSRESVAISLGPGGYGGGSGSWPNSKPSNWKTRICNKWEITGYCPFGSKCHFAHGSEELYRHGGGAVEGETRDLSAAFSDSKQTPAETLVTSVLPRSDVYYVGVPSQKTPLVIQRPGQTAHQKWKGPDKISRIYGDWIDDAE